MWHGWRRREIHPGFWWGNLKGRDLCVDGRITWQWVLRSGWGGMDWIDVAKDRGKLQAVVNTVMNLQAA